MVEVESRVAVAPTISIRPQRCFRFNGSNIFLCHLVDPSEPGTQSVDIVEPVKDKVDVLRGVFIGTKYKTEDGGWWTTVCSVCTASNASAEPGGKIIRKIPWA